MNTEEENSNLSLDELIAQETGDFTPQEPDTEQTSDTPTEEEATTQDEIQDQGNNQEEESSNNEEEESPSDILSILKGKGFDFDSEEAVIEKLNFKAPEPEKLPKELESAHKWIKSGKSFTDFSKMFSKDFDSISGKENQYEVFRRENEGVPEEVLKFKFEEEYSNKYAQLLQYESMDDDEKEDYYNENSFKIEGQKKMREHDEAQAKTTNTKWLEESLTNVEVKEEEPQYTQEEIDAALNNFKNSVNTTIGDYKGYNIPIEGLEEGFNVGMNDEIKETVSKIASDPTELNKLIGELIGSDNAVVYGNVKDYNKLVSFVHKMKTIDKMGSDLKNFLEENGKLKTIEESRENPYTRTPNETNPDSGETSLEDLIKATSL